MDPESRTRSLVALTKRDVEIIALPPALQTWMFIPHVISYFLAYGALFVGGLAAVLGNICITPTAPMGLRRAWSRRQPGGESGLAGGARVKIFFPGADAQGVRVADGRHRIGDPVDDIMVGRLGMSRGIQAHR